MEAVWGRGAPGPEGSSADPARARTFVDYGTAASEPLASLAQALRLPPCLRSSPPERVFGGGCPAPCLGLLPCRCP